MKEQVTTFADVLGSIASQPWRAWVFLPKGETWSLRSRTAVLEMDEVPPELEDEPDAGMPEFAKLNDLREALPVTVLQDVITNLLAQNPSATLEDQFSAFEFYYRNDAFIITNELTALRPDNDE